MAKLSLTDVTATQNQTSLAATINSNHTKLETALEKTLSRDGTSPNSMEADLDMNSMRILNLPYAESSTEPATLGQLEAITGVDFTALYEAVADAEAARDDLLNQKGEPNGIAPLGSDGKVPEAYVNGITDGDKGDITVSGSGATWTVDDAVPETKRFTPLGTGAVTRTIQEKIREIEISIKDFGAVGNGSTDDTAAITASIAAAKALIAAGRTGVILKFPAGQYRVSSTIVVDTSFIRLVGEGKKVSRLVRSTAYGHTLNVTNGGYLEDIRIEGLGFIHSATSGTNMTGGHINVSGVTFLEIRDNHIEGGAYGVILNGCVFPRIVDNYFHGNYQSGVNGYNSICAIYLQKTSLSVPVQIPTIVHIARNSIAGGNGTYSYTTYPNWQYGIIVNACEELHITENTIIGSTLFNIFISQTAATDALLDIFIQHNFLDPAGCNSVRAEQLLGTTTAYAGKISFTGNQVNGEGQADLAALTDSGDGIVINGNFMNVVISDNIIDNWYGNGVNIISSRSVQMTGNILRNNNAGNTKSASGIKLGASAKGVRISGGQSGYKNDMTTGNTLYGLVIAAGAEAIVSGLDVSGNATGGVSDGTAAVTTTARKVWVQDCFGFNGNRTSASPTMPASTVDQYNPYGAPAIVSIFGGTLTAIKLNGTTIFSVTAVTFPVGPGDRVSITYTAAPSWIWWPR